MAARLLDRARLRQRHRLSGRRRSGRAAVGRQPRLHRLESVVRPMRRRRPARLSALRSRSGSEGDFRPGPGDRRPRPRGPDPPEDAVLSQDHGLPGDPRLRSDPARPEAEGGLGIREGVREAARDASPAARDRGVPQGQAPSRPRSRGLQPERLGTDPRVRLFGSPHARAAVSTPLTWKEVEDGVADRRLPDRQRPRRASASGAICGSRCWRRRVAFDWRRCCDARAFRCRSSRCSPSSRRRYPPDALGLRAEVGRVPMPRAPRGSADRAPLESRPAPGPILPRDRPGDGSASHRADGPRRRNRRSGRTTRFPSTTCSSASTPRRAACSSFPPSIRPSTSSSIFSRTRRVDRFSRRPGKSEEVPSKSWPTGPLPPRTAGFASPPPSGTRSTAKTWLRSTGSGLDGVVAKRVDLPYLPGERTAMRKIKVLRTADCVVGGFRYAAQGEDRRVAAPRTVRLDRRPRSRRFLLCDARGRAPGADAAPREARSPPRLHGSGAGRPEPLVERAHGAMGTACGRGESSRSDTTISRRAAFDTARASCAGGRTKRRNSARSRRSRARPGPSARSRSSATDSRRAARRRRDLPARAP